MAFPLARRKRATAIAVGERSSIANVAVRVLPHGIGLALGSVGFGCIATFITLFYAAHDWTGAALSLSVFGVMFVGTRFVFGKMIVRVGGYRVAMVSFAVEAIGLSMLWLADDMALATAGAAVAGMGFSLIFPALGVEAVNRVPENSRGAAVGVFTVFLDVAMVLVGPLGRRRHGLRQCLWLCHAGRRYRRGPDAFPRCTQQTYGRAITGYRYCPSRIRRRHTNRPGASGTMFAPSTIEISSNTSH